MTIYYDKIDYDQSRLQIVFMPKQKLNAMVEQKVIEELDKLGEQESRSRSQMVDILLQEAIKARHEKQSLKEAQKND